MSKTLIKQFQQQLSAQGYKLPAFGPDGDFGRETYQAAMAALADLAAYRKTPPAAYRLDVLPAEWLPRVVMNRIVAHWTAGTHKVSTVDREHYHVIVAGDGSFVRGTRSIAGNVPPLVSGTYAAHTLNLNSYAIGISVACMGGDDVKERPFNDGRWPMTEVQFESMCAAMAQMAVFYAIPVQPESVLSHAEVQPTLGVKQKGKWDFTRLSFKPELVGAKACGDYMRSRVNAYIQQENP